MDKLQAIGVFVQVVDAGSFAKAAERLGVSTTAASRAVKELELALGARLLHRSTRQLSLTSAGARAIEHYRQMLDGLAAAEAQISHGTAQIGGRLKIAMPDTFGRLAMSPMLREFASRYPEIELDVWLSDSKSDLVREGADVAIRIALEVDSSYIAKRLTTVRVAICASPEYLKRSGEPQTPSELVHHRCLIYTGNDPPEDWHLDGPAGRIVQRVRGPIRANSGDVLRGCALAGDGIILQPTFLIGEDIRAGRLVRILRGYEPAPRGAFAVYHSRRQLPAAVRAFIDFMAVAFEDIPSWDVEAPMGAGVHGVAAPL